VQRIELAHGFLVEGFRRRRLVEVEVAAEDLIRTLAREHHLHAHRLDAPGEQVHRRGGAHGGDVVAFDVADHLRQRVQPFGEGVDEAVVHGAERVGGDLRGGEVGRAFQADGEGMQARPPRFAAIVVLDPLAGELGRAGGDQRGIQPAGEQHAVGHVGHQLAMHRLLEGPAQLGGRDLPAAGGGVVAPGLVVITMQRAAGAVVDVAGRERRHVRAHPDQRLHFRSHAQPAHAVVAPVQRTHADRVARDQVAPRGGIPQREGEDAVEPTDALGSEAFRAELAIERVDHLAVRAGGEVVGAGRAQLAVVVDLAVHRQRERAVARQQGLRAAGRIDDGQALMDQDGAIVDVDAAPVRAAMTLTLRELQRQPAQGGKIIARGEVEDAEDRTHGRFACR